MDDFRFGWLVAFLFTFYSWGAFAHNPWEELEPDLQIKFSTAMVPLLSSEKTPETLYNFDWSLNQRVSTACLLRAIKQEGLLDFVDTLWEVNDGADIVFLWSPAHTEEDLIQQLQYRGYWDGYNAGSDGLWGFRSRWRGPGLHFYGLQNGQASVHIDLVNMAPHSSWWTGLKHLWRDKYHWSDYHTAQNIYRAAKKMHVACGIGPGDSLQIKDRRP